MATRDMDAPRTETQGMEAPGTAAVQDDASFINVLLTGLHTTSLAPRAGGRRIKIHTVGRLIARDERTGIPPNLARYF
ncbi:hypothetical protein GCM10009736_39820 [Actinomadura bangladeshensis]